MEQQRARNLRPPCVALEDSGGCGNAEWDAGGARKEIKMVSAGWSDLLQVRLCQLTASLNLLLPRPLLLSQFKCVRARCSCVTARSVWWLLRN